MSGDLQGIFEQLRTEYQKPEDVDFPINKIRFYMNFLWQAVTAKPLADEQKTQLKQFIDLLNFLDDHKLDPTRDMIAAMSPQLSDLINSYPSLAHTFTVVTTSIIPAYQKYLMLLEDQVKNARPFTSQEVLLYYDMTLLDHLFLSHFFEREEGYNILEVIETIKAVVVLNAIVHDYIQDASGKSISMFTFIQRGGVAKERVLDFMQQIVNQLNEELNSAVQNPDLITIYRFLEQKLLTLALNASNQTQTPAMPTANEQQLPNEQPMQGQMTAQQTPEMPVPMPPAVPASQSVGPTTDIFDQSEDQQQ